MDDLVLTGVNIAGFVGSLFSAGIVTAEDIHLCLDLLVNSSVDFLRLRAMHALIVHANDKLCKTKHAPFMRRFRQQVSVQCRRSGHFIWGRNELSRLLVAVSFPRRAAAALYSFQLPQNIINTIDKWFARQMLKQVHSLPSTPWYHTNEKNPNATSRRGAIQTSHPRVPRTSVI